MLSTFVIMKKKNTIASGLWISLICTLAAAPVKSYAQSTAELHAGYEQYWKEDLEYLKNIRKEKDNHLAALEVTKMKEDMLPKLQKQLEATNRWKKSHTAAEIDEEKAWALDNPLQKDVAELQTNLLIGSSTRGGELAAAFGNYMKAMSQVIKKTK